MRLPNLFGRLTRRKKLWLMLLFAIVSGAAAAWLSIGYLRTQVRPVLAAEAPRHGTSVAVAARDLPIGTLVRGEDVRLMSWPSGDVPAGYATSTAEVVGRGVIVPVVANEPLLRSKLASKDGGGGLPITIPEGMRAVSVRVDEVIAVAGFVVPGTRVDVVTVLAPPGSANNMTSRVVLQNVTVLAAGQTVQRDAEGKPMTVTVITLLVTPEEAEVLTLSATQGRIQLALRNTLDVDTVQTHGIQVAGLVGYGSYGRRPGGTASDRRAVVEMYRGGERTLKAF
jgi:pilus assembly protein CpaB